MTAELIELGALVTGIDPSEEALAVARERVPDAAFFQAELHDIPLQLRRRRFTVVYAGEGTLALVPDLAAWLSTVAAALRKGGRLDPLRLAPGRAVHRAGRAPLAGELLRAPPGRRGRHRGGRSELRLEEVVELPPPSKETGDPRIPYELLVVAKKLG